MEYGTITVARQDATLVVTFNRPSKRNALSRQLMAEVIHAVDACEGAPDVRAIVLTGGPELYSAGADLNEVLALDNIVDTVEYFSGWHKLCAALEGSSKPVLAAIEGYCLTGGLELALACDIRVAGEGSTFGITSSKLGTVPGGGGAQRLARTVGQSKAMEILFAGEPIDAREAHRIGLVNKLVPAGTALQEALALGALYAKRAPLSLAWNKRVVRRGAAMDLASSLEYETFLVTSIFATGDRKEGISAFLEKRAATFTGK